MGIYTNTRSAFPSQVVSDQEKASIEYGKQVAQAIEPPQSASIPGILFCIAPSITERPFSTSTVLDSPEFSIYVILGI